VISSEERDWRALAKAVLIYVVEGFVLNLKLLLRISSPRNIEARQ